MKVYVDDTCIGCGLCASTCPDVFHMTDEGVAEATDQDVPSSQEELAEEALENCPSDSIHKK